MTAPKHTLLIVDDTTDNLDVLLAAFADRYTVVAARNGEKALQLARRAPPSLILLDIMMPGMDGYQVCHELKADPSTRAIPVLFLTALTGEDSELRGLALGAVDYIYKPISVPLVQARVANHLALMDAHRQLETQVEELAAAAQLRDDVDQMLRHDLKAPLNPVIGFAAILRRATDLSDKHRQHINQIHRASLEMLTMINRSLDLYKMERGDYAYQPARVAGSLLLQRVLDDLTPMANDLGVTLALSQPGEAHDWLGDDMLSYSLLCNLIKNAIEASTTGDQVRVTLTKTEHASIAVCIHNTCAVPAQIRARFFEKFVTANKHGGTGLGTYSARLMVETQGGAITLDSSEAAGTTITVTLPACSGE